MVELIALEFDDTADDFCCSEATAKTRVDSAVRSQLIRFGIVQFIRTVLLPLSEHQLNEARDPDVKPGQCKKSDTVIIES